MALTEQDVDLLFRLIEGRFELRERLRAIARDARLEELATALRDLERRMDERFVELAAKVEALAAAQARTEERLEALAAKVEALAAAQARTEERLNELAAAQARTEERLEALAAKVEALAAAQGRTEEALRRLTDQSGAMKGQFLETRYRDRAGAYFGRFLRRARAVEPLALEDALSERLSEEELFDVLNIDLVVVGTAASHPEKPEVWVAVEISNVVDSSDVARALRRAALLGRSGRPVVPAVAGERVEESALAHPSSARLLVLEDGRARNWEPALAAALSASAGRAPQG